MTRNDMYLFLTKFNCYNRFGSPNFLHIHSNNDKPNWVVIISIILLFIIIILLSSPDSVQPRASYVAYSLLVLLFLLILRLISSYLKKKYLNSNPLIEAQEQTYDQMNDIYSIDETFERQNTNGSQLSLNSEYSMPPKYEMPPSYSQAVSTLTLY